MNPSVEGRHIQWEPLLDQVASELGIAESVIWLPHLSHKNMVRLYSAATALIFPSLYEGGGIPVLEAMACGCPVTASDISTTQEFGGDAVLMFNAMKIDAIVDAMGKFAEDPTLRKSYASKGIIKAKESSPKNIAGRLLAAYQSAVQTS